MNTYETSGTVQDQGRVLVAGVPFAAGTEVEISISPKRRPADEFAAAWRRVSAELRGGHSPESIGDDEIQKEIDAHRAGQ